MDGTEKDKSYGLSATENDRLFSEIAPKYDFANHLLSLNIDKKWRRELVRLSEVHSGERVLDVCTGTSEVAIQFAKANPVGEIVGIDLSEEMLGIAREKIENKELENKIELLKGNALELPFEDSFFDIVSVAFGLRNMGDYDKGISEMVRVLKNAGRLVMLEFSPPTESLFGRIYRFYLSKLIPFFGGVLSGSKEAYQYLSDSVCDFPKPEKIIEVMKKENLKNTYSKKLTAGIVYLYRGQKEAVDFRTKVPAEEKRAVNDGRIIQGDLFNHI